MQTVSLYDKIAVSLTEGEGISCTSARGDVPTDGRNIAVRAAEAFWQALGQRRGCAIHLEKEIPQQAGLGGGSADGAAVLEGLNRLTGAPFSREELMKLGLAVGADLPFCLYGGTALVTGIGEVNRPLPPLPDCCVLLVKPAEGVSTAACFAAYDRLPAPPLGDTEKILSALEERDLPAVGRGMFNELRQAAGLPQVRALEQRLQRAGALGAVMSGSGSAVCALFPEERDGIAVFSRLRQEGFWTALCRPVSHGPIDFQELE